MGALGAVELVGSGVLCCLLGSCVAIGIPDTLGGVSDVILKKKKEFPVVVFFPSFSFLRPRWSCPCFDPPVIFSVGGGGVVVAVGKRLIEERLSTYAGLPRLGGLDSMPEVHHVARSRGE